MTPMSWKCTVRTPQLDHCSHPINLRHVKFAIQHVCYVYYFNEGLWQYPQHRPHSWYNSGEPWLHLCEYVYISGRDMGGWGSEMAFIVLGADPLILHHDYYVSGSESTHLCDWQFFCTDHEQELARKDWVTVKQFHTWYAHCEDLQCWHNQHPL